MVEESNACISNIHFWRSQKYCDDFFLFMDIAVAEGRFGPEAGDKADVDRSKLLHGTSSSSDEIGNLHHRDASCPFHQMMMMQISAMPVFLQSENGGFIPH